MQKKKFSIANICDSIAEWALLLTVSLLPLWFIPSVGITLETAKFGLLYAGTSFSLLFYLGARIIDGEWRLPNKIATMLLKAVVAAFLISNIFASDNRLLSFFGRGYELGTTLSAIVFVSLAFLAYYYFGSDIKLRRMMRMIAFTFSIAVVYQLIRFVIADDAFTLGVFFGRNAQSIGRYTDFAILSGLVVLFVTTMLESHSLSSKTRLPLLVTLVLGLFMLVAINFPFVWLIMTVFGVWIMFYGVLERGGMRSVKLSTVFHKPAIYIALISAFMLASNLSSIPQMQMMSKITPASLGISSTEVRPPFDLTVLTAYDTMMSGEVFGIGPNRFMHMWRLHTPNVWTSTSYWNLDFDYGFGLIPTLAVTVGVVGFLILASLFGVVIYRGTKSVCKPSEKTRDIAMLYFAVLYLLAFTVVYIPAVFLIAFMFVLIGILLAADDALARKTWKLVLPSNVYFKTFETLVLIALLVGVVFAGYGLTTRYMSYKYYNLAYKTLNERTDKDALLEAEKFLNTAIAYNSRSDMSYKLQSEISMMKANILIAAETENGKKELSPEAKGRALELFQTAQQHAYGAIKADPTSYQNYVYASQLFGQDPSGYQKVKEFYDTALALNPNNPDIYLGYASLAIQANDLRKAREYALQSIAIKPNYTEGYVFISRIALEEKKVDEAIDALNAAYLTSPQDPVVAYNLASLLLSRGSYEAAAQLFATASRLAPLDMAPVEGYALAKIRMNLKPDLLRELAGLRQYYDNQGALTASENVKKLIDAINKLDAQKATETPKETAKAPAKK